jgi:hypothetical protein
MALKALDQRMAGSSASNAQTTNNSQSQPPRPPPAAAASRSDAPAMPSSAGVAKDRQTSNDEAEAGETAKPKEENR